MEKLAMMGGARAVPPGGVPRWPVVTAEDEQAVRDVLASGRFTSASAGEREIKRLEREWADLVGVRHCAAVSNGTAALSLAISALGVQPGDEVIVPALGFIACAVAPLHVLAVPVFADIDPVTFNVAPAAVEAAITPRTRAIMAVHLHGLPADMEPILAIAARHGLDVIEDAAQAHGASYRGRMAGSLGRVSTFSLNVSKNLPTCGEGGLVTTDDAGLHGRILMMRQFGEVIPDQGERSYVSHMLGWNHKINAIQAAFTRSQLARFADASRVRDRNVRGFLARLDGLAGLVAPAAPPDRDHAWHILRFRVDPGPLGLAGVRPGALRAAVVRALRAEGVPAQPYQLMPLPAQPALQGGQREYRMADYPNTLAVIEDSFTIQRAHLNPEAGPVLEAYADAFAKVWEHMPLVARYAANMRYQQPWERARQIAAAELEAVASGGGGDA